MSEWTKDMPTEPGEYYMRDDTGGPSLYEFVYVDGELCHGAKHRSWRLPVGTGMVKSVEWKELRLY